jgi:hypothetical protein
MANIYEQRALARKPVEAPPSMPASGDPAAAPVAPPVNIYAERAAKRAPAAQQGDNLPYQAAAGIVTGIPSMIAGTADAQQIGQRLGLPPGADIIGGFIAPAVDPLLRKITGGHGLPIQPPTHGEAIRKGLSSVGLNPNDYFEEPKSAGERIARMAGEGAVTALLSPNKGAGLQKLIQMGKEIIAGTVGGAGAQAGMEVAPDEWDAAAGLVGGLGGGMAGYGALEGLEAGVRAVGRGKDSLRPAFARDATGMVPERAAETTTGRLAAERLAGFAENPEAAAASIDAAAELVPGSRPTAGQASGDRGLLSFERALARNDQQFKAALLDRVEEQNAARVAALDNIEATGDIGAAVQFFRDRMRTLEQHADTLYNRAEAAAKGEYDALGDRSATDIGEQARGAIAGRLKNMSKEASVLWDSIDPDRTLIVAANPLVTSSAKIYGAMSPEEALSLSPSEKNIADIIGGYGDTIPFHRFKDLRSEITRAMREARSFANPNDRAYRRLSLLRDAVEEAVEKSITEEFDANPALAEQFAERARQWYADRAQVAEAVQPAGPSAPVGDGNPPTRGQEALPRDRGAEGDTGIEPVSAPRDQGLPEDVPDRVVSTEAPAIEQIDPRDIGVDARRFQFKEGGDEQGVTERLQGVQQWDPRLAGTVLVFRDAQGKDWVADGHQRTGLARRLIEGGHPPFKMNAFVLDAADGITDADARAIAAVKNIAEGTGSPIDAAKVLRAAKETGIDLPPLPPRSTLVRDGMALADLSPDAFGMVINEVIPSAYGAIVGRMVKDHAAQEEALRVIAASKPENARQVEMIVRDMLNSGIETQTRQGGLFGAEAFASSVVLERAKIADQALKLLKQDKRLFATLVDEAERIEGAGNALNRDANKTRLSTDEQAADLLTQLAFRAGPTSTELTRLARGLKNGEITPHAAARDFLKTLRTAIEGGLDEGDSAGGAGARPEGEEGAPQVERDPDTIEMFQAPKPWREGDTLGEFNTERGLEGLPQAVIPGTEVTDAARMDLRARKPLSGGNAPPPKGGLFDEAGREDTASQMSLFQSKTGSQIRDTMADRFAAAGRSPEEAVAAGELIDSFYTTMAERLGVPVEKLIEQHPLPQVRKGGDAGQFAQAPKPETPAFDRWFGDSKVVDAEGKPLVVYHGTRAGDFEAFDPSKIGTGTDDGWFGDGLYFTPDPREASGYAQINAKESTEARAQGNVYPVYLKAENPYYTDIQGLSRKEVDRIRAEGHDSIMFYDILWDHLPREGDLPHEIIVFDPTQIKSQFNRGTFDPSDPRILFQSKQFAEAYGAPSQLAMDFSSDPRNVAPSKGENSTAELTRRHDVWFGQFDPARDALPNRPTTPANNPASRSIYRDIGGKKVQFDDEYQAELYSLGDALLRGGKVADLAPEIDRLKGVIGEFLDPPATTRASFAEAAKELAQTEAVDVKSGRTGSVIDPEKASVWNDFIARELRSRLGERLLFQPAYRVRDLPTAEFEEFSTGKPVTFDFERRKASATAERGLPEKGDQFGRDLEPSGRYMIRTERAGKPDPKIEAGTVTFRNPLVINEANWKKTLSDAYGGLTGKRLSQAIIADGHDGIVTVHADDRPGRTHLSEIVDLTTFDAKRAMYQTARGAIEFGDTGSIISMFEGADASTALHESGHHFLKMFKSMAEGPDVPETIARDWSAAKAWWEKNAADIAKEAGEGVTPADVRTMLRNKSTGDRMKDLAIDRGLHEQWARGFEAYLRDGKAPNQAMRGMFQQFKDWLTKVYRDALQLNVKLSPEIRGVFDRMLSTEKPAKMMDSAAAERFSKATAATREIKDTFGAKPVKAILKRPGTTYPYDMSSESVSANLFKPGPEGAAAIKNVLRAGAPKDAIEASAVLSMKKAATKDGKIDPAKLEQWRMKHGDALREVPDLDAKFSSAAKASEAFTSIAAKRKEVVDEIQRSAVGKLLQVTDDADVSAVLGRMLNKDTAVRDMRALVAEARRDPDAMAGLRRALVEHMIGKMKTPKDALRADTFQRFLGKNAPALQQVLDPQQMQSLRAIAADLKRASRDTRAPGGGSDTAENLAAKKQYGMEKPSILGQIIRRSLGSAAVGVATHALHGPLAGFLSSIGSFLGAGVIQSFRDAGLRRVDDLIREAVLNPDLMKALLMKAPKRGDTGSALTVRERLANIATSTIAVNLAASQDDDRAASAQR